MDGYVTKPIDGVELARVIDQVVPAAAAPGAVPGGGGPGGAGHGRPARVRRAGLPCEAG